MHTKTLNIDSGGRNRITTKVHHLYRNSIQATLCAFRGKGLEPSVVKASHVQPRSFLVQSQHGQLRRNRRHLSKTNELPALFVPADQLLTATSVGAPHVREVPAAPPKPVDTQTTQMTQDRVTRSGRIVKTPVRYQ